MRRLDDRIRDLCARLSAIGQDGNLRNEEIALLLEELLSAIHQKVERIRAIAVRKLVDAKEDGLRERRAGLH